MYKRQDIIGSESNDSEIELILTTTKALQAIGMKNFKVKLNDRRLLRAVLMQMGFAENELDSVCTVSYTHLAVGKDMVYMFSASYILYYYQDILGVSAIAMGMILMAARVFDAFNDPVMGVIVAKTRTRDVYKRQSYDSVFRTGGTCIDISDSFEYTSYYGSVVSFT